MKRKILGIAMAMFVLVIVAACSGEENNQTATKNEDPKIALAVSGDTVSKTGGCVLANQFAEGDSIIFRMNATNAVTNEQLKDAKLQVHLSTGEVLDMAYGPHADQFFWVVSYPITEDTPKGKLDYYVTAEYGRQNAEFHPFKIDPSLITIVEASALTEKPEEPLVEEEPKEDLAKVETTQNLEIFSYNFTFLNKAGENKFYVKVGEEVTIDYKDEEGIHGFDIQGLDVSIKEPGKYKFTPTEAGEYKIVCNIFCGTGHESMASKLVVVE